MCCPQRLLRSPVLFMLVSLGCTSCSSHGSAQHLEAPVLPDVVWYRGAVLLSCSFQGPRYPSMLVLICHRSPLTLGDASWGVHFWSAVCFTVPKQGGYHRQQRTLRSLELSGRHLINQDSCCTDDRHTNECFPVPIQSLV